MKSKHIFVPALDIGEILPFVIKKTKTLQESLKEQERAKQELVKFIGKLELNFKEPIYYMGFDVIGEKSYERFLFEKNGFLEIMVEAPCAINAHFTSEKQASMFCQALKKTLREIMLKDKITDMFIDSIQVQSEKDTSLTVERWKKMKDIRGI